jgi:protocatechuate 3,4-dioxygenase beta subunit
VSDPHPPYLPPAYQSTALRAPSQPLIMPAYGPDAVELSSPVFGHAELGTLDNDLTRQHRGEPLGERIVVTGRVLDGNGKPAANTLVEIWQANAAGRYPHPRDNHNAPIDPNFFGAGRTITDAQGRYRFTTIRPGEYPWRNHYNAWRPAHIHFSLFGPSFLTRLVTQMYFPGDPLLKLDPILQSIRDERAQQRLISRFDLDLTRPEWCLGYRFDLVLRGRDATPFEDRT